jgi:hypothetical protein
MSSSLNHIRKLKILRKNIQRRSVNLNKEMAKYGFLVSTQHRIDFIIRFFGSLTPKRRRSIFRIGRAALKKKTLISLSDIFVALHKNRNYDLREIPTIEERKYVDLKRKMRNLIQEIRKEELDETEIFDDVWDELAKQTNRN